MDVAGVFPLPLGSYTPVVLSSLPTHPTLSLEIFKGNLSKSIISKYKDDKNYAPTITAGAQ